MMEKKYAKIINEETYEVQVGVGCPDEYYIEIGMVLMDVEQGYDGRWYVAGHTPIKPEPTIEEKKTTMRYVRDSYINGIEWRVSRYRDQREIDFETTDSATIYGQILRYMQYLRDYPESSETWYQQEPKTFEEWQNNN